MRRTLFISDLHLSEEHTLSMAHFLHFIKHDSQNVDALYILGDFFESWIGDDTIDTTFNQTVIQALQSWATKQIPIYWMHGNRDFLVGRAFEKASGSILLSDPITIELYQKRVLLTHGDALCQADRIYQIYRYMVHRGWLQRLWSMIPLATRQKLAKKMRQTSQQRNQNLPDTHLSIHSENCTQLMNKHRATLMIHGHTHQPGVHRLDTESSSYERIVLGAWYRSGSVLSYFENGHYRLDHFTLKPQST